MYEFLNIFTHQIFITCLIAYLGSQSVKFFGVIIKTGRFSIYDLFFLQGGLPSSHSSTVASITGAIFLMEGASNLFMLSLMLACIVLTDSAGVRCETGKQTRLLNLIIKEGRLPVALQEKLMANIGHTPFEVVTGGILGITISVIVHFFVFQ